MDGPTPSGSQMAYHGPSRQVGVGRKIDEAFQINLDYWHRAGGADHSALPHACPCPELRPLLYASSLLRRAYDSGSEKRYPGPHRSPDLHEHRVMLRLLSPA